MRRHTLEKLNAARKTRDAVILVTDLACHSQEGMMSADLLPAEQLVKRGEPIGDVAIDAELERRFRSGQSGRAMVEGKDLFFTTIVPPPRLVIIGAVHITKALVPMARIAGLDVSVIDPRTAFATSERFEGIALHAEWPDKVPVSGLLDAYTALVAVTHDPKIDDHPLIEALNRGCFYVGALGSRKTHARRVERLLASGLSEDAIARIDAPIGLDIGASGPEEIAVSILAAIILALRGARAHA